MQVCPNCGRDVPAESPLCEHCGYLLRPQGPGGAPRAASAYHLFETGVVVSVRPGGAPGGEEHVAGANDGVDRSSGRLLIHSTDGQDAPVRELLLEGSNVTIGRASTCTVSLPDDQLVSRLHAILDFDGTRYSIVDLASSNGTLLNGRRVEDPIALEEGDRITIGHHLLIYTHTVPLSRAVPAPGQPAASSEPRPQDAGAAASQDAGGSPADPLLDPTLTPTPPSLPIAPDVASPGQPDQPAATAAASAMPPVAGMSAAQNTGQLIQLRSQLMQSSTILAEWAERTAKRTRQMRAELAALAQAVDTSLAGARHGRGVDQMGTVLQDILRLAEQAESETQHQDAAQALAARAADIAQIARTQQALLAMLEALRTRLAELTQVRD